MNNTSTYIRLLKEVLEHPADDNTHGISHELIGAHAYFDYAGKIAGVSDSYVQHEFEWYESQDLCIKGHAGIENNPIWKKCASSDGHVNSNYGWCVFSADNGSQFDYAVRSLINDRSTKQAVMIYTRPSIHVEACDNIHACYDMICTCYTNTFIRNGHLVHNVHMRSNDIWSGLRYDLLWQQYVVRAIKRKLVEHSVKDFAMLEHGYINWFADSLHIYERDLEKIENFLKVYV